tara:strand:- start:17516 stop:18259 length:744 start_codon:yes stop_codon:yes gene_type:complete
MRIIARLDIKNEFLIKGINLEGLRKIGNAGEEAINYYEQNIDEMIYIDSVASLYSRDAIFEILKKSVKNIFVPITVGGGIKSVDDAVNYFSNGADKIFLNTAAVLKPELIDNLVEHFGKANITLSVEAKERGKNNFNVYTSSGRDDSGKNVKEWIKEAIDRGVGEIFLTSVDNDGLQKGFNEKLIETVLGITDIPLIISGGFGNLDHLNNLNNEISGIAIGSAFHYKKVSVSDVKNRLIEMGFEVRL